MVMLGIQEAMHTETAQGDTGDSGHRENWGQQTHGRHQGEQTRGVTGDSRHRR